MHNPKTSFNFCSNCDLYLIVGGLLNATLRDVMVFATVCDQVPLLGFEKQPKYEFSARNTLPTDSTCGPTLHLPLNIYRTKTVHGKDDICYHIQLCIGFGQV